MAASSTKPMFVIPVISLCILAAALFGATAASAQTGNRNAVKQPTASAVSRDKAHQAQLTGIVVDTSGAVIAGAAVHLRSADGTLLRTTQSDTNGSFMISGLPPGSYRLIVSNFGFGTTETPVTIETKGTPAPLRISLIVGAVSTTVNVQGRADDLIGIANSAGQITVGAEELKNRPILRSGEILEALPGLIITQHAGGGKANQYFLRGFNSTMARTSPSSSTACR